MNTQLNGPSVSSDLAWGTWPIATIIVLGVVLAHWLTPTRLFEQHPVSLERLVPEQFGGWRALKTPLIQQQLSISETGVADERSFKNPYDEILMRTYADREGHVVMLALAYGKRQGQEIRVHRPELCYAAQGSTVSGLRLLQDSERKGVVPRSIFTMYGSSQNRLEQVLYWIRIGDTVTAGAFEIRKQVFLQGMKGYIPDGMLVRVSQIIRSKSDGERSIALQQRFLNDLIQALPPQQRHLIVPGL